jgi:uncharacterized repeat protein (TIGR01451 family)
VARRLVFVTGLVAAALLFGVVDPAPSLGHDPKPDEHAVFRTEAQHTDGQLLAAAVPTGFQDGVAVSGLAHPVVVRFASDGRVFVAEKSGLIKVFSNLADTTPTVFADLRGKVADFWDRGLLGMALPPDFPTNPFVYVLYTYDAAIGGTAPRWNDACPSPPGPTTDGCVVSARLARLRAAGDVSTGPEQILINDWCQQFPSHSIGTVDFGPDGALYVSAGDGASFTVADYGQRGGSTGSPTPTNPCGDPPNPAGTAISPPTAEGGALRSQDVRTVGGNPYATVVMADAPLAYWRLGETSGSTAADQLGSSPGTFGAGSTLGVTGALTSDVDRALRSAGSSGQRPLVVAHTSALDLGNGPFTIEAWARRTTTGTLDSIVDYGYGNSPGGPMLAYVGDRIGLWQNGVGLIAQDTGTSLDTSWHHLAATWDGTTGRVYRDGVLVSGSSTSRVLGNQTGPLLIGANQDAGEEFSGDLDEIAIYRKALTAAQIQTHAAAGLNGPGPTTDPTGLDGALLRLDPATGAALPDNPNAASTDPNVRRIIAYGFRNPFRFTFRPGTSEVWVGDVGWNDWEELNLLASPTAAIRNFGWPCYEGNGRQSGYDGLNLSLCETLYTAGSGAVVSPHFTYSHSAPVVTGEACPFSSGSSISGLAYYEGGSYPGSYNGGLFVSDYSRNCIWFMPPGSDGRPNALAAQTFISQAAGPVNLEIGPGGDLFYPAFDEGAIHRVTFAGSGNQPPTSLPTALPTSGVPPLTVAFDGTGSTDPEGQALTYAWDFDGDGTDDASTATASHTYTIGGTYVARLRVTDPGGASDDGTVTINVASTGPVPTIDAPLATRTWAVGETISFSGGATDAEDGQLPADALSWSIVLHHCPTDPNSCHPHAVETINDVSTGSFVAPDHDYPSYLEIVLTATDSSGQQASTSVRIDPRAIVLSFATAPAGLQIAVGSSTSTAPFTRTVIEGSKNTITAPSPQDVGGVRYVWQGWSDGGAQTHDIRPTAATTYTATFTAASADLAVSQTAQPASGQATLNVGVSNAGPGPAAGVALNVALSSKLNFVSATSTVGSCSFRQTDRTVVCSPGTVASGGQVTVTIVVSTTNKGANTTIATVSSTTADLNTANNSDTETFRAR